MFNLDRYAKWIYIAMGLFLLVGVTGWISGSKNGNLIFSSAITIIFVIMGVSLFIIKLPELRHGRERAYEMKKEELERELQQIKKESDLWDSITIEKRKNLCERLGISSRRAKLSLIEISTKDRKMLMYLLNVEFTQKDEKTNGISHLIRLHITIY